MFALVGLFSRALRVYPALDALVGDEGSICVVDPLLSFGGFAAGFPSSFSSSAGKIAKVGVGSLSTPPLSSNSFGLLSSMCRR